MVQFEIEVKEFGMGCGIPKHDWLKAGIFGIWLSKITAFTLEMEIKISP